MTSSDIKLLIEQFLARGGSDLYLSCGAKPNMRNGNILTPLDDAELDEESVRAAMAMLLTEQDHATFARDLELNTAMEWGKEARLRINCFMQQQKPGLVIRRISSRVPDLSQLKLPPIYAQLAMERRGLVLIAGPAHSGKSSTFAAMIHQRNLHGSGHIVTIEDPVELLHTSRGCIVTQREVGIDTHSLSLGLVNAVRQSPDMIAIGELRETDAVQEALKLAEMGQFVLSTLTAGNVIQALEQLLFFFPEKMQSSARARLAHSLRAVIAQRLVPGQRGKLVAISEVLVNEGLSRTLIREGKLRELREYMEQSGNEGLQSFDQSLAALALHGDISDDVAIAEAENVSSMRMRMRKSGTESGGMKPTQF